MRDFRTILASLIVASLSACSSSGAPATPSTSTLPEAPSNATVFPVGVGASAVDTNGSDWPEFRRDDQRTGDNPYQTKITTANVASLAPKWSKTTAGVFTNPIVKSGVVYEGDNAGNLFAWSLASGAQKWVFTGTGPFISTPYLSNGTLYVAENGGPSGTANATLYAINATTGTRIWQYYAPNLSHMESSPLVANGLVYEGTSDRDESVNECDANDQLVAVNQSTGALVSTLSISTGSLTGADIWASPMRDPSGNIYVATGNECTATTVPFKYANSVIRIHPSKPAMGVAWSFQSLNGPGNDEDFGATPLFVNNMVVETGKDGYTYALNPSTGALIWHTATGAAIGSSGTDGTHVFIPTEKVPAKSCAVGSPCGAFIALNLSDGSVAWSIPTFQQKYIFADIAAPAVSNGIVYAAFNGSIWALNANTGTVLWSYATPNTIVFAPPTIVNGGLLVGEYTKNSTFLCFTPNGK